MSVKNNYPGDISFRKGKCNHFFIWCISNNKLVGSGEMKALCFRPPTLLTAWRVWVKWESLQRGWYTVIALWTPWARDLCAQSDQSSAVTCAGSTITTGLACGMQFCHRVLCSAQQCLGKSVEEALVASQALVSPHLMFIFGHFLVGIKCAWESRDRKWGLRSLKERLKQQDHCSCLSLFPHLSH